MSESDVYGRQILTYKDGPRTKRAKIIIDIFLIQYIKHL